jgi:hypothetical protein
LASPVDEAGLAVFDSLAGAEPPPADSLDEAPPEPVLLVLVSLGDSLDEAPTVDAPEFVDFGESVL